MIELDLDGTPRRKDDPMIPDTGVPDGEGRVVDMGPYETSSLIFMDGFESGSTSQWSSTVGGYP